MTELERNILDVAEHFGKDSLLNLQSIMNCLVRLRELEYIVENAPTVYGYIGKYGSSWGSHPPGTFIQENNTHKAKLILIEEL